MPSLLQGYAYDIFISYRQKDNKGDQWVTEFVNALRVELEATFKEDISIYFDENPHDGLLETHDVDASLKEKLKCLIFIPIISRTYCDPKCFAWNHEFLAFLKTAEADSFGLKIKLPSGNTANRVLPIRIHELDARDKKLVENELRGPLRPIDFTFQSSGINRPLLWKDDESIRSQDQLVYRDQINKTANAIEEIISGLRGEESYSPAEDLKQERRSGQKDLKAKRNLAVRGVTKVFGLSLALMVALLALSVLAVIHFSQPTPPNPTYRASILPPEKTNFSTSLGGHLALSPDGNLLAFVTADSTGKTLLWVRPLKAETGQVLSGTEDASFPFWSPDSRFIGFFAGGKLKKIAASGGPPQTLCEATQGRGGSWSTNGTIVFCPSGGPFPLSIISVVGGAPAIITKLDSSRHETSHRWPYFLPDGEHFLYSARTVSGDVGDEDAIFLGSLDTTFVPQIIVHSGSSVSYANGHLLFTREQTLMALPFDAQLFQPTGDAIPIAKRIYFESLTGNASFSVSQNGILVYQTGANAGIRLLWYDRSGKHLGTLGEHTLYFDLHLSPDGKTIATTPVDIQSGNIDVWLYEIGRSLWTRFTFDFADDRWPTWSPDGSTIVFGSHRKKHIDLYQRAASGAGSEELLFESNADKRPSDWSPNGRFLAFDAYDQKTNFDIWILPMDPNKKGVNKSQKPFLFLQTPFFEGRATFSPDGRWIAYQSNESGRAEIYIRPFPGPGGKWQVSANGGSRHRWRDDGKELFFIDFDGNIMSVDINPGPSTLEVGEVRSLFQFRALSSGAADIYDVTSDGQRFVVSSRGGEDSTEPVRLVVNWLEELKK